MPEMKRKWNSSIKPVILVLFLFVANFAALGTASETHASESYANSSEHSGQSKVMEIYIGTDNFEMYLVNSKRKVEFQIGEYSQSIIEYSSSFNHCVSFIVNIKT